MDFQWEDENILHQRKWKNKWLLMDWGGESTNNSLVFKKRTNWECYDKWRNHSNQRWVFSSCSLTSIAFPNSITTIEECAFCGCPFASTVIPNNSMINGNVFSRCFSLPTATLHETFEKQKDGIFFYREEIKLSFG